MGDVDYVARMKNMKEELVDEIMEQCYGKTDDIDVFIRAEIEEKIDIFVKDALLCIVVPMLTEVGNDD